MPKALDHIIADSFDVYDQIIDVRSPAEYAEDHIPGAINLPVLDNDERAKIGTLYVQESRFLARREGAALIARNVAHHLDTALKEKPATFRPLVYCWRGGNRSWAMATIFDQIGWQTDVLVQGYKTWRKAVVAALRSPGDQQCPPYRIRLIDGMTGCGKTAFLAALRDKGGQVIDLEAHANHLGSVFGGRFENQPSQKQFEGRIYRDLITFDPEKPIFVEAESSKIGRLHIPVAFWKSMRSAPRLVLKTPISARIDQLLSDYHHLVEDRAALAGLIQQLKHFHSGDQIKTWLEAAKASDLKPLVKSLLHDHYDKLYARGRAGQDQSTLKDFALNDLSPETLSRRALDLLHQ